MIETIRQGGSAMLRIQWSDQFATGNHLVDHQHQALFRSINEFAEAVEAGAGPAQVDEMLEFLGRYVQEHFATEEFLMTRVEYPGLERHKGEHERLLQRVVFIKELRAQDPGLVPPEGMNKFLGSWLQNHILVWDQAFFEHEGVSYWGIARATMINLWRGHVSQGGSTLTQQVVKQVGTAKGQQTEEGESQYERGAAGQKKEAVPLHRTGGEQNHRKRRQSVRQGDGQRQQQQHS